jgi:hypothetical protein
LCLAVTAALTLAFTTAKVGAGGLFTAPKMPAGGEQITAPRVRSTSTEVVDMESTAANGKIFYSSNRTGGVFKIHTVNADGTNITCLMCKTGEDTRSGRAPAVSPDGSLVAYVEGTTIKVMDSAGNFVRNVAEGTSPAWSPDGANIVFSRQVSTSPSRFDLFIISQLGIAGTEIRVTEGPDSFVNPAWGAPVPGFPQGRIAYSTLPTLTSDIYVIAPTDGNLSSFPSTQRINVTFSAGNDSEPDWSPDGTKLVFQSDRGQQGSANLYAMESVPTTQPTSATPVTRLTNSSVRHQFSPNWSPDGSKVIFGNLRNGSNEILLIDVPNADPTLPGTNLTNDSASDIESDWSPVPPVQFANLRLLAVKPLDTVLGTNLEFKVQVQNLGTATAANVKLRMQRTGSDHVSLNGVTCPQSGTVYNCSLGNLGPLQISPEIVLTVKTTSAGQHFLSLEATSDTAEPAPDPYPNTETLQNTIFARLELIGLEVTQGVQDLANSIQLIALKPTFVRAYFKASNVGTIRPELVVFKSSVDGPVELGTVPLSNSGKTTVTVSNEPKRADFEGNPYFEIPAAWTRDAAYMFRIRLNGSSGLICEEPDTLSDCTTELKNFNTSLVMPLELVSLTYNDGIRDYTPSDRQIDLAIDQIRAIFPIENLGITRSSMRLPAGMCPNGDDYGKILNLLNEKRKQECPGMNCAKRYMGLLDNAPSCGGGGVAWLGGFIGVTSVLPPSASGGLNPAHEYGHSIGLPHVNFTAGPGQVPDGPGPHDPADGSISVVKPDFAKDTIFGFDILNINRHDNTADRKEIRAFDAFSPDFMSYASARKWVSELHYKRLLSFIDGGGGVGSTRPAELAERTQVAADEIVMVNGLVALQPAGTSLLEPIYRFNSPRNIDLPATGTHQAVFEGSAGQVLATYSFTPPITSDGPGVPTAPFSLVLPWAAGTTKISVKKDGQTLASRQASTNTPLVTITSPNGGETLNAATTQVQWSANDADPGTSLRYMLQFSSDNGTTWKTLATDVSSTNYTLERKNMPGTTNGLIRVFATDGFNTASDVSNAVFTVAPHAPQVTIGTENNKLFVANQLVTLNGSGFDVEDGMLTDPNLTWSSNLNGALGTGKSISIAATSLQEGTHTITLTGKDSNNQTGTATTTVRIFRTPPALPAALQVNQFQMFFSTTLGGQIEPQALGITNGSSGSLDWSASANQPWIGLGTASGSAPGSTNVTINTAGLAAGTYSGKITVTSNGANSPQIVDVYLAIYAASPTVTGTVTYGTTPTGQAAKFVPGVLLTAAGSTPASATTNASGGYSLGGLGSGAYTVTPTKSGSVNGSISGLDAARVAQHVAGLISLTANQQVAGDATNNGGLSGLDAARIAQFAAGLTNPGIAGQWKFTPPTRTYGSVSTALANENFEAILVGEVTGNWTAPAARPGSGEEEAERIAENAFSESKGFNVPISIGDTSGKGVLAYEFTVLYKPETMTPADVAVDTAGTLSDGWTVVHNSRKPGEIRVVAFGTSELSGSGTLLNLRFLNTEGKAAIRFADMRFNESEVQAEVLDGKISLSYPALSKLGDSLLEWAKPWNAQPLLPFFSGNS